MTTNFGAAAQDYAQFRVGFPDSLFERLQAMGFRIEGQDLVDVGTGTGALARGFALRRARVVAIDPDPRMLAQAGELDRRAGVTIDYRIGTVEALPLSDDSADVVTAGQCWHWFDGPAAAREISRITRRGGRVVVVHFDWLPIVGSVAEMTERMVERFNPKWALSGGNGFHPESIPDLMSAGFSRFESFAYDVDVTYTHASWRGRIRSSAGVGATLGPDRVKAFDAQLAAVLTESFPGDPLTISHRVFAVVATLDGGFERRP